ncbi:MAG: MMPL family transporter [Planctomycetes bacterium]|nr:MMPL family transporter [Planctomycetota bacterium]
MYERLAKTIERHWRAALVVWLIGFLAAMGVHNHVWNHLFGWNIPDFREAATDGEFAFLPTEMQSLLGEQLLAKAFPEDLLKSSVVIVVERRQGQLLDEDRTFIEQVLKPRLESIRDHEDVGNTLEIMTREDKRGGKLLDSADGVATLVIMPLRSEFLEWRNEPIVNAIQKLLEVELPNQGVVPTGLGLFMSGSATVGRDMLIAGQESAEKTDLATVVLVVALLLVIYRAPALALIPLLVVAISVAIAKALVIGLTQIPALNYRVFFGMEVYITVVTYGTGVDYCLFLIARYKEEIDRGLPLPKALTAALSHVGAAITASAFTVICGIGMMVFAQFGKFREAGIGISLSLCVGLVASLTLTPALLRLFGRYAFWPYTRTERIPSETGAKTGTTLFNRLIPRGKIQLVWEWVGNFLLRYPGRVLIGCFVIMLPFAILGVSKYEYLSYGLLTELPTTKKSVEGAKAVQAHFPAGYAGPLTILIRTDELDDEKNSGIFDTQAGSGALEDLIQQVIERRDELGISDVRYFDAPMGLQFPLDGLGGAIIKKRAKPYYTCSVDGLSGCVARVDVVFQADPFARESIAQLNAVESAIHEAVESAKAKAEQAGDHSYLNSLQKMQFHFVGPTASIRDLKTVTDRDQINIDLLVLVAVFAILVILLGVGKWAISLYLIVSVFFSYFVTLGVVFSYYYLQDPANFAGLDWKVPMFLFTILMAIGEDYNIFLMTRIAEEQQRHGLVEGIRIAMFRTGTIISSCGIIMAGTFVSLMFGTLVGLHQLGFALAFGVLLDTFVVRPLLVPAYLVLLYRGKFGPLTPWLGGPPNLNGSSS